MTRQKRLEELWQGCTPRKEESPLPVENSGSKNGARKEASGSLEKGEKKKRKTTTVEKKSLGAQVLGNHAILQHICMYLDNPFDLLQLRGLLSLYALKFLGRYDLKNHLARRYLSMMCGLHLTSDEPVPYARCQNVYVNMDDDWQEICDEHGLDYEDDWTREDFEKQYCALKYVPESIYSCARDGSSVLRMYNNGNFTEDDVEDTFECPELCINYACQSGLPWHIVRKLFKETGLPVTYEDQMDQSCLHYACLRGHYDLVKPLVNCGLKSNVNLARVEDNIDRSTPLMKACVSGNLDIVKYLVEKSRANVRHVDIYGIKCPLSIACSQKHVDVVRYLLGTRKAKVNRMMSKVYFIPETKRFSNETLLGVQVAEARNEIAKILIKEGNADLEKKNSRGSTTFVLAAETGNLDMIRFMVEHCKPIDLESTDKNGRGAILHAACNGHAEVLKYLVEHAKLQTNVRDRKGKTLHDYALESKHKETIDYVTNILQ